MQPHTCSSAYDSFAEVYSRWMAADYCRRVWPAIERLLLSRLQAGAHILDVCCGAGKVAQALGKRGFYVTGIDVSAEMLRLACENAPGAEFILADVRSFSLPRIFHGALSTFNSFAHLHTTEDLLSSFSRVRAALVPNGQFLFDLSMEAAYSTKWRGLFRFEDRDCTCIIEPDYDSEHHIGRNRGTLTRGEQSTHFCIEQKCHSEDELRAALCASGFKTVQTFDAQHDLGIAGEYGRLFFLCT